MTFDDNYAMLVAGDRANADATFEVLNPATEQVIAHVPDASCEDLGRIDIQDFQSE